MQCSGYGGENVFFFNLQYQEVDAARVVLVVRVLMVAGDGEVMVL